ncbi:hydrogenase expression/formation protein [Paracraurococcus lichenis]|uniref:Hydrogenase expression/formation protein n=1 Tax=Paracraurococcus lichenis TaxID=3064888 RepID=A0ABT9DZK3_9PROT|nr:hydrogenase expression/formation protein [Paracraurococcus sp. LOR1-02]MDO9709326.1 hydrogenase expression/formation protein [Paracraurococcus sp. LOR1-02]
MQPLNPMRWDPAEEEAPEGVFIGEPDPAAAPRLLGMPAAVVARARPDLQEAGAEAAFLAEALAGVRAALAGRRPGDPPVAFPLDGLAPARRRALDGLLGQGEVSIVVAGQHTREIQETVLTGLWRVRTTDATGRVLAEELEVAEIPDAVLLAAEHGTLPAVPPPPPAEGLMNAPALIEEIRARAASWRPGAPNHVISFTLLPVNEADMALLRATLGTGPVLGLSRGYGHCRVQLTGCRRVWSVQYLNARDAIVLDTLEIGGVPEAILAAAEDFADSALRLGEILEAYAP